MGGHFHKIGIRVLASSSSNTETINYLWLCFNIIALQNIRLLKILINWDIINILTASVTTPAHFINFHSCQYLNGSIYFSDIKFKIELDAFNNKFQLMTLLI